MNDPNKKKPSYSYPLLKPVEVVRCMNDLSIQFEENDLAKPSSIKMMQTYEAIIEIFMGISKDSSMFHNGLNGNYGHQDLAFGILEVLDYPDLHVDAIAFMAFYRHL